MASQHISGIRVSLNQLRNSRLVGVNHRLRVYKLGGRWPGFFEYKDPRVYGFNLLMLAEPDAIYTCLSCASSCPPGPVCEIWNVARDFLTEPEVERELQAILFSKRFSLRRMSEELIQTIEDEEECPERDHPVMKVVSRLVRALVKESLRDRGVQWSESIPQGLTSEGARASWSDLTDAVRDMLHEKESEVVQAMTLSRDLGL